MHSLSASSFLISDEETSNYLTELCIGLNNTYKVLIPDPICAILGTQ